MHGKDKLHVEVQNTVGTSGDAKDRIRRNIEIISGVTDAEIETKRIDVDDGQVSAILRFPNKRAGVVPSGKLEEKMQQVFSSRTVRTAAFL